MIELLKELYPICSSITGNGLKQRLEIIKKYIPINIHKVKTGTKCFNWEIPKEWNIKDAWIKSSNNKKIIDFKKNNLHVLNYSIPIHKKMNFEELSKNLFYLKDLPDSIPYLTSYYNDNWGFCLKYNQYCKMDKNDEYEIFIDSTKKKGHLYYGDILISGKTNKEILFSCYLCHPSMCNDSLSGVVVCVELIKYILSLKNDHYYSYRFIFIPETIGSICYLSKNLKILKENVIGGYVLTTCGDEGEFTFLKSMDEQSISNKIAKFVLDNNVEKYKIREFFTCGSDERQFNSPNVELNIASVMKTKYGEFKEYHTSKDNFDLVTQKGLNETYNIYKKIINIFEINRFYISNVLCEAQLGKYGLYNKIGGLTKYNTKNNEFSKNLDFRIIMYYLNGRNDLLYISKKLNINIHDLNKYINILIDKKLISLLK